MANTDFWNSFNVGWGGNQAYSVANAGLKEQVKDVMTILSPDETPTLNIMGSETAPGLYVDWMVDRLSTAADVPGVEGQEAASATILARTKLYNYVQHFQGNFWVGLDNVEVSRRNGTIGVADEYRFQAGKRQREKLRDVNIRLFALPTVTATATREDYPSSATTGPRFGNLHYWASQSSSTAYGTTSAQWINGAGLAVTSAGIYSVMNAMWANNVTPDTALMSGGQKISLDRNLLNDTTLGTVRNTDAIQNGTYSPVVDVIKTSLGRFAVVVDRWIPQSASSTTAATDNVLAESWYLADRKQLKFAWWRPFKEYPLPPTGDNMRGYVRGAGTVMILNPHAIGGVYRVAAA